MTAARWLVVVAIAHALSPLVLLGAHWAFGPDETIYLSQLNGTHPALYFSAPRARGATLLAAPVTLLTSSIAAVRVWVAALSGIGLWLAFRPWLRLVPGWVVPAAAAVFSSLWVTTMYAFQVMPNEWVAFAAVGGCGALLRWFADGRRRHLVVVAAALAVIGLLRPSDAAYVAAGLGLSALLVRAPWRARAAAVLVLAVGVVLGVAQWVVEAETSFGGIASRVHVAQAEQGGGGPFWSLPAQSRVLAGPLLCRGSCHADTAIRYRLWWVALVALVAVAVAAALRRRAARVVVVPVVTALFAAAQYVLTVPYGAPRFLLPAYALLAIPTVLGARELTRAMPRPTPRRLVAAVLVVGFLGAAALQLRVLTGGLSTRLEHSARLASTEADLLTAVGARSDCMLVGHTSDSLQVAYALRCTYGPHTSASLRRDLAEGRHIVWLHSRRRPGLHARWERIPLPGGRGPAWVGSTRPLVAPRQSRSGAATDRRAHARNSGRPSVA